MALGECDRCGRIVKFIVSRDQYNRYADRINGKRKEKIQDIFPDMPREFREMFRYPMPCTCPKCWKEMFSLNP